jgi:hypothetical protein
MELVGVGVILAIAVTKSSPPLFGRPIRAKSCPDAVALGVGSNLTSVFKGIEFRLI